MTTAGGRTTGSTPTRAGSPARTASGTGSARTAGRAPRSGTTASRPRSARSPDGRVRHRAGTRPALPGRPRPPRCPAHYWSAGTGVPRPTPPPPTRRVVPGPDSGPGGGSAHETAAEALGHRLRAVGRRELAEQAPRVRLDGVLGQVELAPDLTVALALAHPAQDLHLALGEVDAGPGLGGAALRREDVAHRGAGEGGHELGARGVPAQVAPGAAGDGGGDAARVVRRAEDDDVGTVVGRDEPAGGLGARADRA